MAKLNWRIGHISKLFAPGYGSCFRCHTTWPFVDYHITAFGGDEYWSGRGGFPLCEKCWGELTPEGRIPYYDMLLASWSLDREEHKNLRPRVVNAILAGK